MNTIAVIPARGGSKRIPAKNIRLFAGKPMLAWSINAAIASGVFGRVIVSTDDETVAVVAREHGAEVPFLRPAELSGDSAAFMPVIRHAVREAQKEDSALTHAFAIYATAPFIAAESLRAGVEQLRAVPEADFVLAVTCFEYPVQRALIEERGELRFREPDFALRRSQELPVCYRDAGQFFGGRIEAIEAHDAVLHGRCLPVFIPREAAVDIDTEEDWRLAERLHRVSAKSP